MGKYRDMFNNLFTMSDGEFEELLDSPAVPKFKGKIISYDTGDTEINPHYAFVDPDFKKEFNKMSDEEKQKAIAMIMNLQFDAMDGDWSEDKILDMLDAEDALDNSDDKSDRDNPHDEDLYNESERILDKVVADVADDIVDEHIDKTRKNGASFVPRSETGVKAMLEANKKGVKLSDKNTKNVGDCVSDRTMKNIVETLSQYRW